uniref:Tr-type G domain-containing protein n=1 Tax=Electrophorus electricus TaxID=8005 RepID=A0A4W4DXT1_ELEEL
ASKRSTGGNPSVYKLNLKDMGRQHLNKKDFGCPSNLITTNKTIMLLGATGSGKTTLINGMINYILGVKWSDEWRLKLIDEQTNKTQAESQTAEVTAYQIHCQNGFRVPYSVTIIDTPGSKFFSEQDGILGIDAVCFVVQSALARLTQTQKYIFEAVLSIFGRDIANNITIMITFADGQKPPVLDAIEAADIPCIKKDDGTFLHFKFNNSALFAQNKELEDNDDEDNFDAMFWKMGTVSMKRFFAHLETMETKSLQLTNQVLFERKQLEATVTGIQPLIQTGLAKLDEIKMTSVALEQKQYVMKENENFEYQVDTPKYEKVNIEKGKFITNCIVCNYTCHYPCAIPVDKDKAMCSAMKNGCCAVCPGKCLWNVHHNMAYRIEIKTVKETRTYNELKNKYETALGEKMTIEKIMQQLEKEYYDVQISVFQMSEKLAKSLTRLKEIALRPDPLATPDYIDLLIESEKQMAKEGFRKRIAELEKIKQQALILQKVERGEPLTGHEERSRINITKRMLGVFNNVAGWFKQAK